MQKTGQVDDDIKLSALALRGSMIGQTSPWMGEALERHRNEGTEDLDRQSLGHLVKSFGARSVLWIARCRS